jgi:hypothetical protein
MKRKKNLTWGRLAAAGALLLLVGVFAYAEIARPPRVDGRNCPVGTPSPNTLVLFLDTSDQLLAAQPREARSAVDGLVSPLARGDRLIVFEVPGEANAELVPLIDQCDPGDRTNVERNAFRNRVSQAVDQKISDLQNHPSSHVSPLIESIVDVAGDAQINSQGTKLTVALVTDGLQNSPFASAYSSLKTFSPPRGTPLKGIAIKIVLLKNIRDIRLQPKGSDLLAAWLMQAGAAVQYQPPAWLSVVNADVGAKRTVHNERRHRHS